MSGLRYQFPLLIAGSILLLLAFGWLGYGYSRQVLWFPAGVGILTVLFCLLLVIRMKRANTAEPATTTAWHHYLLVCAILPALVVFGFSAGCALYVAVLLKTRGESWKMAAACGLATFLLVAATDEWLWRGSLPGGWFA